jgi:RimJ/RimL family protein N-acetyltransferase
METTKFELDGNRVRLEPLELSHLDELWLVADELEMWELATDIIANKNDLKNYLERAISDREKGIAVPFAIRDKVSDKIVGSTRFGNIDRINRRTEIGWTWLGADHRRTYVNTEMKYLMIKYAFEVWKCIRVELKTDVLNMRSRNAMLRMGAKEEGVLRNHIITASGRYRDSIFFSIIESEWPAVRSALESKIKER